MYYLDGGAYAYRLNKPTENEQRLRLADLVNVTRESTLCVQ